MSPEENSWTARRVANTADGTQIPVYECGEGETLLLVHGWTLDHSSFNAQLPLASDYRLVCFDRRGAGRSAALPNLGAEVSDINSIIDSLACDRVHLLGVSQGARIALRFAAEFFDRLQSLTVQGVVVDGYTAPVEDEGAIPLGHYVELVRNGELGKMHSEWLAHPLMSSDALELPAKEALEHVVRSYRGDDLRVSAVPQTAVAVLERLENVPTATLVITGERETAARKAHAAKLCDIMPCAQEVTLTRCGHLSNLSRPEAYNAVLKRFIDALPR
ncbi:alpha/beta fold hydrolase [Congregibacter sp.]|uniref:alpha/beta fold hydrolase n=1 Tax=Congregibacter sp. TaxID=2744308 RepID=UPI003F6D663F